MIWPRALSLRGRCESPTIPPAPGPPYCGAPARPTLPVSPSGSPVARRRRLPSPKRIRISGIGLSTSIVPQHQRHPAPALRIPCDTTFTSSAKSTTASNTRPDSQPAQCRMLSAQAQYRQNRTGRSGKIKPVRRTPHKSQHSQRQNDQSEIRVAHRREHFLPQRQMIILDRRAVNWRTTFSPLKRRISRPLICLSRSFSSVAINRSAFRPALPAR